MEACRSATCTWIDVEYASTPQLVRIVPVPIRVGMIRSSPGTGRCRCRSAPGARPGPVNRDELLIGCQSTLKSRDIYMTDDYVRAMIGVKCIEEQEFQNIDPDA